MRALRAESVRIVAPVPGKNTVGIEAPNAQKEKVRLKELMATAPDATQKMALPLYLGKDASGEPLICDLTAMPHCLIAGTTGSGKSVCINSIIMSIIYQQRPDHVKLILVDPKVVEMAPFKDVPHLMCPIINDAGRATSVLEWACEKMDERYEVLAEAGVRNIKGYNALTREELVDRFKPSSQDEEAKIPKQLPYIIIIIDELADLMMTSGKEVESFIVRLAQKSPRGGDSSGRGHPASAGQRGDGSDQEQHAQPHRVPRRQQDGQPDRAGPERRRSAPRPGRHALPASRREQANPRPGHIHRRQGNEGKREARTRALPRPSMSRNWSKSAHGTTVDDEAAKDELFDAAVRVVLETKRGSVSLLQRRLTIGYSRASRLIEAMANSGIVGSYKGSQAREALFTVEEWDAMQAQRQADAASGMTV